MGRWQELEEDGTIDGEVATHAEAPQGGKDANGGEIGRTSRDHTPDGGEAESEIKSPLAAEDVAAEPPEDGAGEEADVLGEGEKWGSRGVKFVGDRGEYKRGDDRPQIITGPAEADDDKQLPLIPSHTDFLYLQ